MLYHPVKIGSLELKGNLFLAPLAGYSDQAFRSVCVRGGSCFEYSEMVSSEALTRGNDKTFDLMKKAPNEEHYAIQLFGGNPDIMADAAVLVTQKTDCDLIDINAGCPVPKVVKTGSGSSLTANPEQLYQVLSKVVTKVNNSERPVPVSVKIRSGWDDLHITYKEAADAALKAGVAAITMHPRTKTQGYEGFSNWDYLADLVTQVNGQIPVFGSGDIFKPEDAKRMLATTKVDGVMFARGAMGKPFIFRQTKEFIETGKYSEISLEERISAGFDELDILIAERGEKAACLEMRKRFCAYTKGIEHGGPIRLALIKACTRDDYHKILEDPYALLNRTEGLQ